MSGSHAKKKDNELAAFNTLATLQKRRTTRRDRALGFPRLTGFELDSSQSLEGEAVVPGEIVARLLRNLTNICAARLRPPGGDVADIDSQSVAGDLGMVHQTLVTYRALIDGMRALQEGVGRETEPSDGQLWLADSLALEIQSHSIKLGERVKAFEAGEYPYPTYTPRRRDPGDA